MQPDNIVDVAPRGTTPRADYFTASGAYQLRYEIEQFWKARGSKQRCRRRRFRGSHNDRRRCGGLHGYFVIYNSVFKRDDLIPPHWIQHTRQQSPFLGLGGNPTIEIRVKTRQGGGMKFNARSDVGYTQNKGQHRAGTLELRISDSENQSEQQ